FAHRLKFRSLYPQGCGGRVPSLAPVLFSSLPWSQNDLSQMVREMIGSTQQNVEAVGRWVLFVVLIGHSPIAFQPLLRLETGKLLGKAAVHLRPVLLQFWDRGQWLDCFVRLGNEYRLELRMESVTKAENGVNGIVDRSEVTNKIDDSVPPGAISFRN